MRKAPFTVLFLCLEKGETTGTKWGKINDFYINIPEHIRTYKKCQKTMCYLRFCRFYSTSGILSFKWRR
nr:MAG TPA: hypothetical protein [Caudoviricetes sp.]